MEENATAKNQHAGDAAVGIAPLSPFDEAVDFHVVDAFGGTTAIYKGFEKGRGVIQVCVAWKTEFIKHHLARFICGGRAVPSGGSAPG
ncbi:hypothetical protein HMP06_1955 [Sphingomonas sp. HMP6]|nr:hypothetical protein HMP06_1955 [Sphingomonas sp. HMP6]